MNGAEGSPILYARVRDIIGPNAHYIDQSGTYVQKSDQDYAAGAVEQERERLEQLQREAFGDEWEPDEREKKFWRLLCGLGSHDLSLMCVSPLSSFCFGCFCEFGYTVERNHEST